MHRDLKFTVHRQVWTFIDIHWYKATHMRDQLHPSQHCHANMTFAVQAHHQTENANHSCCVVDNLMNAETAFQGKQAKTDTNHSCI